MGRHLTTAATVACGLTLLLLVGSAVEQWIPGTRRTLDSEAFTRPTRRVTVDVRNGGGVTGAARAATERLRETGYDVVSFGNASSFDLEASVVIDRVGDLEMAAHVAQVLGIGRVQAEPDPNLFVDVTVRLGADWSVPAAGNGRGNGGGPRWLRRILERR